MLCTQENNQFQLCGKMSSEVLRHCNHCAWPGTLANLSPLLSQLVSHRLERRKGHPPGSTSEHPPFVIRKQAQGTSKWSLIWSALVFSLRLALDNKVNSYTVSTLYFWRPGLTLCDEELLCCLQVELMFILQFQLPATTQRGLSWA